METSTFNNNIVKLNSTINTNKRLKQPMNISSTYSNIITGETTLKLPNLFDQPLTETSNVLK